MAFRTFADLTPFGARRDRLQSRGESAAYIFFSGEEGHLSPFRPRSSFVYFTGFEEPSAAAVIVTGAEPRFHLFVRPKNPDIELWDGFRFGPDLSKEEFAADQTDSIENLEEELPKILSAVDKVYFSLGEDSAQDKLVMSARQKAQTLNRLSGQAQLPVHDPNQIVAPMRMVKDESEIQWIRESAELSAVAHNWVMAMTAPGKNERQMQGVLFRSFYDQLASREGYSSIIASGANACTLHYRANNRQMLDGDFLLIDAGAEKNYYTADITRTYPVNGKFSTAQRDLYTAVLDVQEKLIGFAGPGQSIDSIHDESVRLLTEKMIELKLLSGSVEQNIQDKSYRKYYPHGVGHYLGMDVHDVGFRKVDGESVSLQENVVMTIEPGIYVPTDDESVPQELRGLGVRIEDDVRITNGVAEVLTATAKKQVADLEAHVGSGLGSLRSST